MVPVPEAGACLAAVQVEIYASLDRGIMAINNSAPSATAGSEQAFFGGGKSGRSLEHDAFGTRNGNGSFDLGRKAFSR